jgi:hypothetical protein
MRKPDFIIAQVFKTDAGSLLLPFAAARVSASHAIFCLLPFTEGD